MNQSAYTVVVSPEGVVRLDEMSSKELRMPLVSVEGAIARAVYLFLFEESSHEEFTWP